MPKKVDLIHCPTVSYRNRVKYNGFATIVGSEDQVNIVLEKVRRLVGPLPSMSYALRMAKDSTSDIIEFCDDDGELGAGDSLLNELVRADLENAIVVVTIEGVGCFSPDFVPIESVRFIHDQAVASVGLLTEHLAELEEEARRRREPKKKAGAPALEKEQEYLKLVNEETGEVTLVPVEQVYGKAKRNMNHIPTFKPRVPEFVNPAEVPLYQADELAEQEEMRRARMAKQSLTPFK